MSRLNFPKRGGAGARANASIAMACVRWSACVGLGLALAQKERRGRSERAKGTLRGGAVTGTPETARNIGDGVDATDEHRIRILLSAA